MDIICLDCIDLVDDMLHWLSTKELSLAIMVSMNTYVDDTDDVRRWLVCEDGDQGEWFEEDADSSEDEVGCVGACTLCVKWNCKWVSKFACLGFEFAT